MLARFLVLLFFFLSPAMVHAQPTEVYRVKGKGGQISPGFKFAVFSPNGKYILTSQVRGIVKLWDAESGQEIFHLKGHKKTPHALAFTPNSRLAVTGSKGLIVWWDTTTGKPTNKLTWQKEWIEFIKYSPDGRYLLIGGDDTIQLIDNKSKSVFREFTEFSFGLRDAEFSPDSEELYAGEDLLESVWIVDLSTNKKKLISSEIESAQIEFNPDGTMFLMGGMSKVLGLYSTRTSRQIRPLKGHPQRIISSAFSPDGKLILTGSTRGSVQLWKARNGHKVLEFFPHGEKNGTHITNVQFSPDGKRFLTVSPGGDGFAVWEVPKFF